MSFTFPHPRQDSLHNNAWPGRFLKRPAQVVRVAVALGAVCVAGCAAATRGSGRAAATSGVSPATARAVRDSLRAVMDRALADSAFPGAYAVVGTADGVIAEYGVGRLDRDDATRPTNRTVWDLASLTKVVGTTSAVLQLVGSGRVALDSPVVTYLPKWTAPGARRVTVRHLLAHNSGLPAWRALYKESATPAEAEAQLFATSPDTLPGVRFLYSDLGFILLGKLVETVSGESLAQYDTAHVFGPLGMRDTRYLPPAGWLSRIAPTEQDSWRGRKLRGEVHDENASRLGGVSGHAGLFSSARDLTRFAQMYLRYGALDGVRVFDSTTVRRFIQVQDTSVSRRALGWETPTGRNSAGRKLPATAFGHTGFTGTSLWMDPAHQRFVLLLTNRVNPTRNNTRINTVRISLADAVVSAMEDTGVGISRGAGR